MASTRSLMVQIRAKPREVKSWRTAAKRADETLSEWIRTRLNLSAVPASPPLPPTVSGDQVELPFKKASR